MGSQCIPTEKRKKKKKDAICFTVRKFTRYIQQDLQCNSPCLACSLIFAHASVLLFAQHPTLLS